ncbi:prophage antirepressor protein [Leifsonia xyli subsp. cynodontis DSM 46306]|uniref:Antirepressor protein ant N-terminal domain-containing protein n=1 Tax=Leifsonia xyli subsp. cynodontis DSM 46306 TaxID=1389489 RepID=U3P8A8_LEIXC|nr:phage antirepressor N-terminal domain-containing protein [Leifsonia xyli]AGW41704.1 prophage antirepressor protein [Leifsonia xyli subsp. cynodontis DSM 46306]
MTELVRVPFRGGEVLAVDIDGKPFVALRPAFEVIGLDPDKQIKKIQARSWACTSVTAVQLPGSSQHRNIVVSDVRTFLMALAAIPDSRVKPEVRDLLIAYQAEVADVIEAYWTNGGAVNPRASQEQLSSLVSLAKGQMAVLELGRNILPREWLEAKAKIVAARALGETPQISSDDLPLYVEDFLRQRGLDATRVKAIRSPFGRRLSTKYREKHGRPPEKTPAEVGGRPRQVNVYYGRDRPLFEVTWAEHFAPVFEDAS